MRVIVTRPEHDASEWVLGLGKAGFEVAQLPLIEIRPVADLTALHQAWQRLQSYCAVMFVSGNAVTHFFQSKPGIALVSIDLFATKTRAWATGPGTARALLGAGVDTSRIDAPPVQAGQFDSEALWAVVGPAVKPGQRVLIVRGAEGGGQTLNAQPRTEGATGAGRDWLATQLAQSGVKVDHVVAYQRCSPVFDPAQRSLVQTAAVDGSVWLLSSSEAVANLSVLMPGQSWNAARAVATHPRIAQRARELGFGVVCESRPILSSVVASIESMG